MRDDLVKRDMDALRKIHPGTRDILTWMKETNYDGKMDRTVLKVAEDGYSPRLNLAVTKTL